MLVAVADAQLSSLLPNFAYRVFRCREWHNSNFKILLEESAVSYYLFLTEKCVPLNLVCSSLSLSLHYMANDCSSKIRELKSLLWHSALNADMSLARLQLLLVVLFMLLLDWAFSVPLSIWSVCFVVFIIVFLGVRVSAEFVLFVSLCCDSFLFNKWAFMSLTQLIYPITDKVHGATMIRVHSRCSNHNVYCKFMLDQTAALIISYKSASWRPETLF